ncbi:hypothetical protein MKW92_052536 [Papaver armeniacum]|nr:hypothetical protein MKW92_052536 [Papaver armeniacum]
MASQVTCNIQKVGPSATQDVLKSLPSLDEGKTLDFMSTNDVTSIDMVIVDKQLLAVIPKNLISKFDKLIREGGCFRPAHNDKRAFFRSTTSITALDAYSVSIIPQKFCFTEFEAI